MPITQVEQISKEWLSEVLGKPVHSFEALSHMSSWSTQVPVRVEYADGTKAKLRLKICVGNTFGRSEVDYYLRDYVDMPQAPLVKCYHADYDTAVGYHLLLEDMSETHHNRREVPSTLEYGLAVAEALGRLHRYHNGSAPVPSEGVWKRYFDVIRPGVVPMEQTTGQVFSERFEEHAKALQVRWADPIGMSLLHGDLNPMNILTPKNADSPVYFLDRQPFDWSLTYGLGAYDLAYFLVVWWAEHTQAVYWQEILKRWYEAFACPGYSWEQAQSDWLLSVEQCLHVPIEWCSNSETLVSMQWLWEIQLRRVQYTLALVTNTRNIIGHF